jgi:hypothetical protein
MSKFPYIELLKSGNLAITGGNNQLNIWNVRQMQLVHRIVADAPQYPYSLPGEVNVIAISPDRYTLAAG